MHVIVTARRRRTAPETGKHERKTNRCVETETAGDRVAAGGRGPLVCREERKEASDARRQGDVRERGLLHLLQTSEDKNEKRSGDVA